MEHDRKGTFQVNAAGDPWWPLDPRPEDFNIELVAHHLAMNCRYGGAVRHFYSVAEHSVLVSHFVPPQFALHGLLHDRGEAVTGDFIKPLKVLPAFEEIRRIEDLNAAAMDVHFGLRWTAAAHRAVDEADRRIVIDECLALIPKGREYLLRKGYDLNEKLGADIAAYSPERAEVAFLLRWFELTGSGR